MLPQLSFVTEIFSESDEWSNIGTGVGPFTGSGTDIGSGTGPNTGVDVGPVRDVGTCVL